MDYISAIFPLMLGYAPQSEVPVTLLQDCSFYRGGKRRSVEKAWAWRRRVGKALGHIRASAHRARGRHPGRDFFRR